MGVISINMIKDKIFEYDKRMGNLREPSKLLDNICRHLENIVYGIDVWYPEKIHVQECGGINRDFYLGYGKEDSHMSNYNLILRIIERDAESGIWISQSITYCYGVYDTVLLEKILNIIPQFINIINASVDTQIQSCKRCADFDQYFDPNYEYPLMNT